jgi:hypothetical protein
MDIATREELAEEAFELDRKIDKCLLNLRDNFLELGEIAYKLKQGKLYRLICPEAKTWEHFISLRFAGIKRGSLDNYAQAYKAIGEFIKDKDIKLNRALDITRIINRLPEAERKSKAVELIESAEVLPKQGWTDTIRVESGKRPSDDCTHENQISVIICTDCQKRLSVTKGG